MINKLIITCWALISFSTFLNADSIDHSHGQRTHKHKLPPVGFKHKHNNGPAGKNNTQTENNEKVKVVNNYNESSEQINRSEFDALFKKAVYQTKKDNDFDPTTELRFHGHSGNKLKDVGLWYLKNAENHIDIEKAAWYLLTAESKISFSKEEKLLLGQVAARAAEKYANPKSEMYDSLRAFKLHVEAANLGIQSSYLAAGYIQRFTDYKRKVKHRGYQSVDIIRSEARYFRKATNCSKENTTRKLFPWSRELCDVAYKEMRNAEKRIRSAYDTPSGEDAALWLFVGIVGLAALAADNGAPSDQQDQIYQAQQQRNRSNANSMMAFGWATVGDLW